MTWSAVLPSVLPTASAVNAPATNSSANAIALAGTIQSPVGAGASASLVVIPSSPGAQRGDEQKDGKADGAAHRLCAEGWNVAVASAGLMSVRSLSTGEEFAF